MAGLGDPPKLDFCNCDMEGCRGWIQQLHIISSISQAPSLLYGSTLCKLACRYFKRGVLAKVGKALCFGSFSLKGGTGGVEGWEGLDPAVAPWIWPPHIFIVYIPLASGLDFVPSLGGGSAWQG